MTRLRDTLVPTLLAFALWLTVTIGLAPLGLGDPVLQIARSIGLQFIIGCAVALIAYRLILPCDVGYNMPSKGAIGIIILPLGICAAFLFLVQKAGMPPLTVIFLVLINAILIGISEEVMFRGLIFGALRRRMRLRLASVASSILFGLSHVSNSLLTGDLRTSILQALSAMMLGEFLAALRMRTGSLWPCILFHTLWNAGLVLMSQVSGPLPDWSFSVPVAAVIILALYAMILWRPLPLNAR